MLASHKKLPSNLPFPFNELANAARHIDVLWFRWLSVATSFGGIIYKIWYPHETPLAMVMAWNAVFISLNLIHIGLLLQERRGVRFSDEEKELYDTVFNRLSPVEFMKLLRLARWEEGEAGRVLATQNEPLRDLMMLYNGRVAVEVDGEIVAQLRDGAFIGEMSLITEGPASATVTIQEPTRYLAWPKAELKSLLQRNPAMDQGIQAVVASDLTKKLLRRDA